VREVLVDGWLVEVEVEAEQRAELRARARRAVASTVGADGLPAATELRADLPGRVVSLFVEPGDAVTAGQQILVIEAMKMLNELRAPRAGRIERVAVVAGQGVELGDLLVRLR
jgi:biotin carboxyl carrier protein